MSPTIPRYTDPTADPVRAGLGDPEVVERLKAQAMTRLNAWLADLPRERRAQQAEDVFQQTVERALARADSYDAAKGDVGGWLHGILVHVLKETCRKLRKQPAQAALDRVPAAAVPDAPDQFDPLTLLEHLSPDERVCVEGFYLQRWSHRQIADRLGIEVGTARARLRRALIKLRHKAWEAYQ